MVPLRTPSLLAFLFVEEISEMALRILMSDDLAKGFLVKQPFCGRTSRATYLVFSIAHDFDQRTEALAKRPKLHARLIEKYNAPQTVQLAAPRGRHDVTNRMGRLFEKSFPTFKDIHSQHSIGYIFHGEMTISIDCEERTQCFLLRNRTPARWA